MRQQLFKREARRKGALSNLTLDIYLNKNIKVNVKGSIRRRFISELNDGAMTYARLKTRVSHLLIEGGLNAEGKDG